MSVKVEVRMDARSMGDFMVYHIFTSFIGIIALVLGALNVGLTVAFIIRAQFLYALMCAAFAFIILSLFPYLIRRRVAKKLEGSTKLSEPVSYEFMEDGIETVTTRDSGKASWGKFKRAISFQGLIILFDHQKRSIILPINELGEQYGAVVDMITEHMPAPAVRIRRVDEKRK